jgi:hypothetical protein
MLSSIAPAAAAPLFKTLSREECESVLLRNNVGRIAFALHDRVSILPINYVSRGSAQWIPENGDVHVEAFDGRYVLDLPLQIGAWQVSRSLSLVGALGAGLLAVGAFAGARTRVLREAGGD